MTSAKDGIFTYELEDIIAVINIPVLINQQGKNQVK